MPKKINFNRKGIIFDFDDTIAKTKPGKNSALKIISSRIHNYLREKEIDISLNKLSKIICNLSKKMDAKGIYNRNLWWSSAIRKFSKEELSTVFLNSLTKQYWETIIEKSACYRDAISTLTYFKNKGYILGLLTDTDGVKGMKIKRIKALNLRKKFNSIVVAGEDTKTIKLDTAPFYLISKRLNLKPEECIFVGNSPLMDIRGSKRVGMITILVKRQNDKVKIKPNRTIKRLGELKEIL